MFTCSHCKRKGLHTFISELFTGALVQDVSEAIWRINSSSSAVSAPVSLYRHYKEFLHYTSECKMPDPHR